MTRAPSEAQFRVLLGLGNGSSVAVTSTEADDPRLRVRVLPVPPELARRQLLRAVANLPRWRVEDASSPVFWLSRKSRIFRLVDDIYVGFEPSGSGTAILARSASRVGKADLGQNRRNLAELWRALEQVPTPPTNP